jgi:hypothetical protein
MLLIFKHSKQLNIYLKIKMVYSVLKKFVKIYLITLGNK